MVVRSEWWRRWPEVVAMAIVAWALVYYPATQIAYSLQRGDGLTELFDAYSEANLIRDGEGYVDRGFLYNYGLPDVSYGDRFDNVGGKHDKNLCPSLPCIYLHYPPGPDLANGAMTRMCGKGNIACLRALPIAVGALALIFFAWAMVLTMGVVRCAFVLGSFYFAPMVINGMHSVTYNSYVTSFLFVQAGFLLLVFLDSDDGERPEWTRRKGILYGAIGGVGFVYGWLSFDYFFHTMLLAVPFWLMAPDWKKALKPMLVCTVVTGVGFTVASFLHLLQVVYFLDGWGAAVADFAGRAATRFNGQLELRSPLPSPMRLLLTYWNKYLAEPQFLGFSFLGACAAAAAPLFARGESLVSRRWRLAWGPLDTYKWSFLAAFLIPDMWLLVMREHASVHGHFLPRNFIVTYVVGAMLISLGFRRPSPALLEASARDPDSDPLAEASHAARDVA